MHCKDMETRVGWREAGMVGVIVGVSVLLTQIDRGVWVALIGGLLLGLAATGLYYLLMPFVIRWAAKGVKPLEDTDDPEPPKTE